MHTHQSQLRCRVCADLQLIQQCDGCRLIIAYQDHVTTGIQRAVCPFRIAAGELGARHADIVTEYHPLEIQSPSQYLLQPDPGETCGSTIHPGIDNMRRHDSRQTRIDEAFKRQQVRDQNSAVAPIIHRNLMMGIAFHITVSREVFAHRHHAGAAHAFHEALPQARYHIR